VAHIQLVGVSEQKSPDAKIWKFPYAFPIMVSHLKDTKHTFDIVDTHLHKLSSQELMNNLISSDAQIFGISAWSHNYLFVKELTKRLKIHNPNSIVIVGGILSGNHKVLMECTEVDIVVTGAEGERILPKILDKIDLNKMQELHEIDGLVYRDANGYIETSPHKVMSKEEYYEERLPDYKYFDKELKEIFHNINTKKSDMPVKGFPLLTMRGCPFSCTFCGHMYGKKMLRRKWDKFFEEVEYLIDNYGLEGIFNYDTNTFLNEQDVNDFCDEYEKRGHTFKGCYELRMSFGTPEMFERLYKCGGRVMLFGFETGSATMLRNMKKGIKIDKMKDVLKYSVEAGMIIHSNFIFGTIGENKTTINETKEFMLFAERLFYEQQKRFKLVNNKSISSYGRSYLIPSPTSELYDVCLKYNLISDEEKYLEYLSDDSAKELLKGSNFKIALAEMGGNVNMSQFTSMDALKFYVDTVWNVVKLKTLFFDKKKILHNFVKIISKSFLILKYYLKYLMQVTIDKLKNRKGFFINPRKWKQDVS